MSSTEGSRDGFTPQHRVVGRTTAWAVSVLLLAYAVTTALGFRSLQSPRDPIGDPYFTVMELLILLIAPAMVGCMVAVHAYAPPGARVYSLLALVFMTLMAAVTSGVHFVVLTVGRQLTAVGPSWAPLVFSFTWPSVVYALDILAWDWFFALSMLLAAPVFGGNRLERAVRTLMVVSGVLSLAGLSGVPLADMRYRNIGIVGYAVVTLGVFPLLAVVFGRARDDDAEGSDDPRAEA